jgi:glycosyltransferase 2 family protein
MQGKSVSLAGAPAYYARVGRGWINQLGRLRGPRAALIALSVALTVVFAYIAVRNARLDKVWSAWRASNYWWLLPSFALLAVSVGLRVWRWWLLFAPGRRPGMGPLAKATLLGLFFNTILPARAGEVTRILALKSYAGTSRAETTGTIVVDRLFDILVLLGLLFVSVPWLPHVRWLRAAAIIGIVALVCILALAVLSAMLVRKRATRLHTLLGKLPLLNEVLVGRITQAFVQGLGAIRRPGQAAAALACTVVSWLVLGVSFWCLMIGFRLHLPLLAGLLVVIATGLAFIIPAAPAAAGVFEAAGLAATSAYGVPTSRALAYVLVLHVLNVLPYLVAGVIVLASGRAPQRLRPRFSIGR